MYKILTLKSYFVILSKQLKMVGDIMSNKKDKPLASNRKASHDYFIEDTIEAGIVLKGTEVKSIRQGKVNLKDSYALIEDGEAYILNMHISPYEQGNIYNTDPLRKRKLLLHKREILKLSNSMHQQGYSLIPLKMYLVRGRVKVLISVAKGKKTYDKRHVIAKKDAERRMRQQLSEKY